jgi:hypothetical protein
MGYVNTGTTVTYTAGAYREVGVERRNAYAFTGVEVKGETYGGSPLLSWRADTRAESDPTYAFFRGYRRLERTEERAIQDDALLEDLRDALYTTLSVRQGDVLHWQVDGDAARARRECAVLNGLASGLIYVNRVAVMNLRHHWGPNRRETYTEFFATGYPT